MQRLLVATFGLKTRHRLMRYPGPHTLLGSLQRSPDPRRRTRLGRFAIATGKENGKGRGRTFNQNESRRYVAAAVAC